MADDLHRTIDAAAAYANKVVDGIGLALGVDLTDEPRPRHDDREIDQRPKLRVIDVGADAQRALPAKPVLALADGAADLATPVTPAPVATAIVPAAAAFRIVPIVGTDGKPAWIVTNGVVGRACPTREFADLVMAMIAKAGA